MTDPVGNLQLMAELALTLLGFTGAVTVLGKSMPREWRGAARLRLANLLLASLTPLFLALLPLILLETMLPEAAVWRIVSATAATVFFVAGIVDIRIIARLKADDAYPNPLAGYLLSGFSFVFGAVGLWNAVYAGAFWPVYLVLCFALAVGCHMFVRLIFDPLS